MPEIRWHNNPVVFSSSEPSPSMISELSLWPANDWKWFNTTNNRWYDYDGAWVMQGEEPPTGLDFAHDGDKMEITKLTIVNGLVAELEFGV